MASCQNGRGHRWLRDVLNDHTTGGSYPTPEEVVDFTPGVNGCEVTYLSGYSVQQQQQQQQVASATTEGGRRRTLSAFSPYPPNSAARRTLCPSPLTSASSRVCFVPSQIILSRRDGGATTPGGDGSCGPTVTTFPTPLTSAAGGGRAYVAVPSPYVAPCAAASVGYGKMAVDDGWESEPSTQSTQ